jgi:type II secretory pathway pseudopilin PulG
MVRKYVSNDCAEHHRTGCNGFILTECLVAISIMLILLYSVIPVATSSIRLYNQAREKEELLVQGMDMEEIIFQDLRYARQITVESESYIRFTTATGLSSGYRLQDGTLWRILANGSRQPLTGNDGTAPWMNLKASFDGSRPCFSKTGQAIHVCLILCHRTSKRSWPCRFTVVPFADTWEVREP